MTSPRKTRLLAALAAPTPSIIFNEWRDSGELAQVIPPLYRCINVEQNYHHAEDVYTHCIAACDFLPVHLTKLRLAALLHDVGKPDTQQVQEGGRITFFNHEIIGARIAYKYLIDIGFSQKYAANISLLVRHHMFFFREDSKPKALRRWLRKTNHIVEELFILRMADRAGNSSKIHKPLVTPAMLRLWNRIQDIRLQGLQPPPSQQHYDLAISGHDIIQRGYEEGPEIGRLLQGLYSKVKEGLLPNNRKALLEAIPNPGKQEP